MLQRCAFSFRLVDGKTVITLLVKEKDTLMALKEPKLDDDYPVFPGYYYVVDEQVIESFVEGTVRDLRRWLIQNTDLKAETVTRCDLLGRGLL